MPTLAVLILSVFSVLLPVQAHPSLDFVLEERQIPCLCQIGNSEREEREITLYFDGTSDSSGEIPYVALPEYLQFLSRLLKMKSYGDVTYDVNVISDSCYEAVRSDNGSVFRVDTGECTFRFSDLNSFTQRVGQRASLTSIRIPEPEPVDLQEYARALQSGESLPGAADFQLFSAKGIPFYNRRGDEIQLDLKEYDIPVFSENKTAYIPFQTLNDLFLGDLNLQCIFTGEKVLCASYLSPLLQEKYEAYEGTFSEEFAWFNYKELCFLLDCFYGLKEEHGISDFGTLLSVHTDLMQEMTGTDPAAFDLALMQLTNLYLDDGHSGFGSGSVKSGPRQEETMWLSWLTSGLTLRAREESAGRFAKARREVFGDTVPLYEEVGDTAFLTIDEFIVSRSYDYEETIPLEQLEDTIDLIIYANRQIQRENSPVKNIVIDLSNNAGGDAAAVIYVMSWLLGEAPVPLFDTLTHAKTCMIYHADVNLDGYFASEEDTVASGYRLFCLINRNAFSCGNLLAAACKSAGTVILAGQRSGGGSCTVRPCTTASGVCFQISGSKRVASVQNGSFSSIEYGIEPDYPLSRTESFYDRLTLAEHLREIK